MYIATCCITTALNYLPESDNASLVKTKQHLSAAIRLGKQYQKTFNSIYWSSSPVTIKKRTRETLHNLAFDAYSELKLADSHLKEYIKEVGAETLPPNWWNDIGVSLYLAISQMEKENADQIYEKQLTLF